MNCTRDTHQIIQNYWIYICKLFSERIIRVARAVHKSKIENSIKKHVQNYSRYEFILDQMKTNHSLHESVISKSNENILAR